MSPGLDLFLSENHLRQVKCNFFVWAAAEPGQSFCSQLKPTLCEGPAEEITCPRLSHSLEVGFGASPPFSPELN